MSDLVSFFLEVQRKREGRATTTGTRRGAEQRGKKERETNKEAKRQRNTQTTGVTSTEAWSRSWRRCK